MGCSSSKKIRFAITQELALALELVGWSDDNYNIMNHYATSSEFKVNARKLAELEDKEIWLKFPGYENNYYIADVCLLGKFTKNNVDENVERPTTVLQYLQRIKKVMAYVNTTLDNKSKYYDEKTQNTCNECLPVIMIMKKATFGNKRKIISQALITHKNNAWLSEFFKACIKKEEAVFDATPIT